MMGAWYETGKRIQAVHRPVDEPWLVTETYRDEDDNGPYWQIAVGTRHYVRAFGGGFQIRGEGVYLPLKFRSRFWADRFARRIKALFQDWSTSNGDRVEL